jgi:hypothetical protein
VTVIERVTVTVPLDPFMSLKALSAYSSLSVQKLRQLIDRDPPMLSRPTESMTACWSGAPSLMSGCRRYRVSGRPGVVVLRTLKG